MMEIEREKTRIRGEEFEKLQRESAKIESNRAKNAETEMIKEITKEKVRERKKARIWCEQIYCNIKRSNNNNNNK